MPIWNLQQTFADEYRFLMFDAPRMPDLETPRGYPPFDELVRPRGCGSDVIS